MLPPPTPKELEIKDLGSRTNTGTAPSDPLLEHMDFITKRAISPPSNDTEHILAELLLIRESIISGFAGAHSQSIQLPSASGPALGTAKPFDIALVAGDLITPDVADAIARSGSSLAMIPLLEMGRERATKTLRDLRPSCLLSVGFIAELATICNALDIPYFAWQTDPFFDTLPKYSDDLFDSTSIFIHDPDLHVHFNDAGFRSVKYLPLAANTDRRAPLDPLSALWNKFKCQLSFAGSSMRANARTRGTPECETEAADFRLTACRALESLGLVVYGPEDWTMTEPQSLDYRGPIRNGPDLTALYSATTVNIDLPRTYQPNVVNMRVFDCMACGGFILVPDNASIDELFDIGEEIVTYSSPADLVHKVQYALSHDEWRHNIAASGRARVLRDHDFSNRLETIFEGTELWPSSQPVL